MDAAILSVQKAEAGVSGCARRTQPDRRVFLRIRRLPLVDVLSDRPVDARGDVTWIN